MATKRSKQTCPVCGLPMTLFGKTWKCMNVKAHDERQKRRGRGGQKGTGK